MRGWFMWNGVDSQSMGILLQEYPPIVLPAERVESIVIPGRAGSLTRVEGTAVYDTYLKTITFANLPWADPAAIAAWLRGSGELIIGSEPDYRYFARIVKEASLKRLYPSVFSGSVSFLVQPYKGHAIEDPPITADLQEESLSLFNPGDVPSHPLIMVGGSGVLSVAVNGEAGATVYVNVGSEGTGALVDVDAMMVFTPDGTASLNSQASITERGFEGLRLRKGANTVTWGENVTELTVLPRWRWI